jgi:hypothetical protein
VTPDIFDVSDSDDGDDGGDANGDAADSPADAPARTLFVGCVPWHHGTAAQLRLQLEVQFQAFGTVLACRLDELPVAITLPDSGGGGGGGGGSGGGGGRRKHVGWVEFSTAAEAARARRKATNTVSAPPHKNSQCSTTQPMRP